MCLVKKSTEGGFVESIFIVEFHTILHLIQTHLYLQYVYYILSDSNLSVMDSLFGPLQLYPHLTKDASRGYPAFEGVQ